MRITIAGATGFVGSATLRAAEERGHVATALPRPPLDADAGDAWRSAASKPAALEMLVTALRGQDAVINAAGVAAPTSRDTAALTAANVTWPLLLSRACRQAGVSRMVHLSTAAVQGRMNPLDETLRHRPFSPYSASKASAERLLVALTEQGVGCRVLCLHRPTSVQGPGRATTAALQRLGRLPILPINGSGAQPLPLALVENVAAGAVFLAESGDPPAVALQPWEGLTTALLYDVVAPDGRRIAVPGSLAAAGAAAVRAVGRFWPRAAALGRYAELLLQGQTVQAEALHARGFQVPVGLERWRQLLGSP